MRVAGRGVTAGGPREGQPTASHHRPPHVSLARVLWPPAGLGLGVKRYHPSPKRRFRCFTCEGNSGELDLGRTGSQVWAAAPLLQQGCSHPSPSTFGAAVWREILCPSGHPCAHSSSQSALQGCVITSGVTPNSWVSGYLQTCSHEKGERGQPWPLF